jgi:hypothetical protein
LFFALESDIIFKMPRLSTFQTLPRTIEVEDLFMATFNILPHEMLVIVVANVPVSFRTAGLAQNLCLVRVIRVNIPESHSVHVDNSVTFLDFANFVTVAPVVIVQPRDLHRPLPVSHFDRGAAGESLLPPPPPPRHSYVLARKTAQKRPEWNVAQFMRREVPFATIQPMKRGHHCGNRKVPVNCVDATPGNLLHMTLAGVRLATGGPVCFYLLAEFRKARDE